MVHSKMIVFVLILFTLFSLHACVPPSPSDRLQDDITDIKRNIQIFNSHLEKLNTIYLTHIEPRLLTSSTSLENINSNVRNIQERAHVWDTFQIHISAWNDQLASLDRKMDILSKSQEKFLSMDTKLNVLTSMDYKIENINKKLNEMDRTLTGINKVVSIQTMNSDPLFGEFAARGILSTLKQIERKLDTLHVNENLAIQLESKAENTKCNSSATVEELLRDVASKVDIIFDTLSGQDEEKVDSADSSEDVIQNIMNRLKKPRRHSITDQLQYPAAQYQKNESSLEIPIACKNITDELAAIKQFEEERAEILHSYFLEQRYHFESILKNVLTNRCYDITKLQHDKENAHISDLAYDFFSDNAKTCEDLKDNDTRSGLYLLAGNKNNTRNIRFCEMRPDGLWTVFQRRDNFGAPQNFSLSWESYKHGFGDLRKEFWLGNEFLHQFTADDGAILRIELEDFDGNTSWAEYDDFQVLAESDNYELRINGYRGNASDSLSSHNGSLFSTLDRKNDQAPACCPCAVSYGGGWWFNSCFESNLNGVYHQLPRSNEYYKGIIWEHWLGNYSLKKSSMMVKLKNKTEEPATEQLIFLLPTPPYEDP